MARRPLPAFAELPDPGTARSLDDLIERLRLLKTWANDPSYEEITKRVNARWLAAGRTDRTSKNTVADCFMIGRKRPNEELLISIVEGLCPDAAYTTRWRQAFRIVRGEAAAATFVHAQDRLPTDLSEFAGRELQLMHLAKLLLSGNSLESASVVWIDGMAGIGKTQLAIHAAHNLLKQQSFDHVLFANLRGFHADRKQPPADPAAILDTFLRLLGVAGRDIPQGKSALERRAQMYRERLRDKQTLVVLDNAASSEQVTRLLPDGPGCRVLVTSRRSPIPVSNWKRLSLPVFTSKEAHDFLTAALGPDRIRTEPGAAARLVESLGYLPMALALLVSRINDNPHWTLADQLQRVTQRRNQLRLDDGIELALGLSYEDLRPDHQRALRLLALHPGGDLDIYTAAALAAAGFDEIREQLDALVAEHLLLRKGQHRYELHDLVRVYVANRAVDDEPESEQRSALTRLINHYLHSASLALNVLAPEEIRRRPTIPDPGTPAPALTDRRSSLAWLDAERPNLIAMAVNAPDSSDHAKQFSLILHRYLDTGAHYQDAEILHNHAISTSNPAATGQPMCNLGTVYWRTCRYSMAEECFTEAVDIARTVENRREEAIALNNLGATLCMLQRHEEALGHVKDALAIDTEIGDRSGEARALCTLGEIFDSMGSYAKALDYLTQALSAFSELEHELGQVATLNDIGQTLRRTGAVNQSLTTHQRALVMATDIGHLYEQAKAHDGIALCRLSAGDTTTATEHWRSALTLFTMLGSPKVIDVSAHLRQLESR